MLALAACDPSQTLDSCMQGATPSMAAYSAHVVAAVKELVGSYFSAGPPAVLAVVVVVYVLSRLIPWVLFLTGTPSRKDHR